MMVMRMASLCFAFALFAVTAFAEVHPLKMSFSKLEISTEGVVDEAESSGRHNRTTSSFIQVRYSRFSKVDTEPQGL